MPDFDSLDAIDKHFKKAIRDAGDDESAVKALEIEQREARADLRERQAARRELDAHRRTVLASAGIPADFEEFVSGDTPEEIDASAAKVKDRLAKLTANSAGTDAAAQAAYGAPAANGGGTPLPPKQSENEEFLSDFASRFNNHELVTPKEIERFVQIRGGRKMLTEFQARGLPRYRDLDLTQLK